jgi:adenosylhomocysteinase
MDTMDRSRARQFFGSICTAFPVMSETSTIVVTHLLPDRPFFLEALDRLSNISLIVPKPKSVHPEVKSWICHRYPLKTLKRKDLENPELALGLANQYAKNRPLVILDIGGYFEHTLSLLSEKYRPGIVGVVEDTENGHQRYNKLQAPPCPIVSVARSPLKDVEDFLVGESIVFSVEALLREQGDILHGRTACVIGYGKVGSSIASLLRARHVRTMVYDKNVIRKVQALSHGFFVAHNLREALLGTDLVFCATGSFALKAAEFADLRPGAYVATVTSSDDEIQSSDLRERYRSRHVGEFVTRYDDGKHYFFLLNRGQAVNFIHSAAVGPFIYLVQGEILASIAGLLNVQTKGMRENSDAVRTKVAKIWCDAYDYAPAPA